MAPAPAVTSNTWPCRLSLWPSRCSPLSTTLCGLIYSSGVNGALLSLQDNVALIAVLEALDPGHPDTRAGGRRQLICVANTHIHANPELNDVKLWQVGCVVRQTGGLMGPKLRGILTSSHSASNLDLYRAKLGAAGGTLKHGRPALRQLQLLLPCMTASCSRWGSCLPSPNLRSGGMFKVGRLGEFECPCEQTYLAATICQHAWAPQLQDCGASTCAVSTYARTSCSCEQ